MRQVILACSATKRHRDKPITRLPAIARYDGPAWRLYRARKTCEIAPGFALSAEHGLISEYFEIVDYDRKMDAARSRELIDPVHYALWRRALDGEIESEIFFFGGRHYRDCFRQAVQLTEIELERDIPVTYSSGGIGEQLGQLKAFLEGRD